MELKETFIENLSKIASGMKQKEISEIMNCSEGTVSKYLNKNKKDFPTVEMLYRLAQHFDVSLDWLVGNSSQQKTVTSPSPREVCKMLLSIYNSNSPFLFGQYTATESCFMPSYETGDITHDIKKNTYISLYFPKWREPTNEDEYECAYQLGNESSLAACINLFLSRLKKISGMLQEGNLTQEMYDILLNNYLNDVPE